MNVRETDNGYHCIECSSPMDMVEDGLYRCKTEGCINYDYGYRGPSLYKAMQYRDKVCRDANTQIHKYLETMGIPDTPQKTEDIEPPTVPEVEKTSWIAFENYQELREKCAGLEATIVGYREKIAKLSKGMETMRKQASVIRSQTKTMDNQSEVLRAQHNVVQRQEMIIDILLDQIKGEQ